jgi:hypothetical protein
VAADPDCPRCDGFGWVPTGHPDGWYQRDWRLLLDPTVSWERCGRCGPALADLPRLHQALARYLLGRIENEVQSWRTRGGWELGRCQDNPVWRWRHLCAIEPGPLSGDEHWLLVSELGVLSCADISVVRRHLTEAGAPDLP